MVLVLVGVGVSDEARMKEEVMTLELVEGPLPRRSPRRLHLEPQPSRLDEIKSPMTMIIGVRMGTIRDICSTYCHLILHSMRSRECLR
jgi:hypothetical protein